jgi:Ser/Thr protein kinase RdoA (MazF antagonist)
VNETASPLQAAAAFAIEQPVAEARPLGDGLINETYRLRTVGGPDFVLQCINPHLFPDPGEVMANIARVTRHLARRGRPSLRLVETRGGGRWHTDAGGRAWRCFRFIANSHTWTRPPDLATARRAAEAYARFVADLRELSAADLNVVLPGFHDTPARLAALEAAVARDRCGRAAQVAAELDLIRGRAALATRLTAAHEAGVLPLRVVHNDTKLSNVLFDRDSNEALCVIDLDTVMPGLLAHDFGDLVRSVAAVGEGAALAFDIERFAALAAGYRAGLGSGFTAGEAASLAVAPAVLSLELAARFLADYLDGDRYFRTRFAGENLERCRGRLALLQSMERQEHEMRCILADAFGG